MDPATLLRTVVERVPAGRRGVEITLPTSELYPSLRGRVVDVDGAPVPGVGVFGMCDAFRLRFQGSTLSTHHEGTDAVRTDAEGRFTLERVPQNLVYLRLDGNDTLPLEWGRHVEGGLAQLVDDPGAVEIVVHRRCHFRVELPPGDPADEIAMLDATGQPLEISEFLGSGERREGERQPLVDGRSGPLAASDTAATLVFYEKGVELGRVAVRLSPGRITSLP
jgi:hypothetical protein